MSRTLSLPYSGRTYLEIPLCGPSTVPIFKGYCEVKALFIFQLGPRNPHGLSQGLTPEPALGSSLYFKHITNSLILPELARAGDMSI